MSDRRNREERRSARISPPSNKEKGLTPFVVILILAVLIVGLGIWVVYSLLYQPSAKNSTQFATSSSISVPKRESSSSESASLLQKSALTAWSAWTKNYQFYYQKEDDHQLSLIISDTGKVIQQQDSGDERTFTGQATFEKTSVVMPSYVISQTLPSETPAIKNITANVKIHVIWDNNGGTQDYYGYTAYDGETVLTDGIKRAGGIDEVWVSGATSATASTMNLDEIAQGNYESIQGNWVCASSDLIPAGSRLIVSKSQIFQDGYLLPPSKSITEDNGILDYSMSNTSDWYNASFIPGATPAQDQIIIGSQGMPQFVYLRQ